MQGCKWFTIQPQSDCSDNLNAAAGVTGIDPVNKGFIDSVASHPGKAGAGKLFFPFRRRSRCLGKTWYSLGRANIAQGLESRQANILLGAAGHLDNQRRCRHIAAGGKRPDDEFLSVGGNNFTQLNESIGCLFVFNKCHHCDGVSADVRIVSLYRLDKNRRSLRAARLNKASQTRCAKMFGILAVVILPVDFDRRPAVAFFDKPASAI